MTVIDANKDEALRCIDISIQALAERKLERAEKFLLKAEKLFPTQKAKDLLIKVKSFSTNSSGATPSSSAGTNDGEPDYTSDQLEAVRKVMKCKDYYETLGVTKQSTDSEIKKAYKKLALQLHPDKNRAPGAVQAFKAVGKAAAILTDPEKRKQYDLCGINKSHSGVGGTGFPHKNVYMRSQRRRQQREERENQSSSSALINLLPILLPIGLLLIGLSMFSSFFISDPIYSLTPSHKYMMKREINGLKIPYYVKDNFYSEYQGSVERLEESVFGDFYNQLIHACSRERNYLYAMLDKIRSFGNLDLFGEAQNINMPSCDNLEKYFNTV